MRAAALLACAAVLCLLAAADRASAQNTAPGKPAIADSGVTAAAQTLTVTWTAPSTTGGAAITAYDVRHIRTNSLDKATDAAWTVVDDAWTSTGGGALSYAITGLRDSASHDIRVRAVNSVGDGDWSDVATATTTDINQVTGQLNTTHLARVEPANDRDRFTFSVTVATRVWFYTSGALNADLKLYTTPVTAGKRPLSSSSSSRWIEGLKGASIAYTLAANTTYALSVGSAGSAHVGDVEVHASVTPTAGTAIASAPTLTLGQAIQGNIASPGGAAGEHEYFKFVLGATTDIWIVTFGGLQGGRYPAASNRLMVSELQDSTGTAIETAGFGGWYGALWTSDIRRQLAAGTYYVNVYGSSSYPRHHGDYELIVREYQPAGSARATAAPAQLHGHSPGDFTSVTDTDYFSIDLAVPQFVDIYVSERGATQTGESDPVFTVRAYDADGGDIAILSSVRLSGLFRDNVETRVRTRLPPGRSYIRVSSNMASGKYVITPLEVIAQPDMVRACPRGQQSDAFYHCQWHLNNTGQYSLGNGTDINVEEVWATNKGAGITIAIVDNGVQLDHEDLLANINRALSHDYGGGFTQPHTPGVHATSMAGLAAARDNDWGVRGVAPRASIYSLKVTNRSTDANIADTLTRNLAATAVTSNSWSLTPAGSPIAAGIAWEMAAERGATHGFGGKGTVHVFAAGNSHNLGDNANLNGLANFHTSVTACAIGHDGQRASYSERGASLWVCAPSNGVPGPALTSTDVNNRYTRNAVGTSAATPVVAGVVALIRAANTNLTARDVKLILAASAVKNHPGSSSWQQGALKYGSTTERYNYNRDYGFGLVDAGAAVTLAKAWTNLLPAQRTSEVASGTLGFNIGEAPRDGAGGTAVTSTLTLDSYVKFIEYIEVKVTIDHRSARDLQIQLRSPSGAVSTLAYAATRSQFRSLRGQPVRFPEAFRFGSARHVGESAAGTWTLTVLDGLTGNTGSLTSWSIKAYGHGSSPGYPDAPTATAGTRSLTVDWAAPTETGPTAITGYDLRYISSSATGKSDPDNWTVVTGIGTDDTASYSLTGLRAGAEYDVQVRAVNTGGAGPWSESLVIRSTLEKPFVSSLTAVNPRDRGLGAIWTAPAEDGGSEITSYDLRSIRSDATDEQKAIATNWAEELSAWTTGELRANIANLTNGVQYDVQVRARNTIGAGDWSATRTGTPAIQNTDPSFAGDTATRDVAENVGVGANVGARVGATDPDSGDTLTYSISGTSDLFEINEANGQLSVKAALDHETGPSHSLTVQVSDGLNSNDDVDPTIDDTVTVTINVTDVNEPPAVRRSSGSGAFSIAENSGTEVGSFVATDPEMKDITWSLAGNDWLDFTIDDGTLSFASEPDFEAPADHDGDNVYQVTVQATDEGGLAGRLPVTVTVEDVNEIPAISGPRTVPWNENASGTIATYTARDPETGAVETGLAGSDKDDFQIDSSGRLSFKSTALPDYETKQRYSLDIVATDDAIGDLDFDTYYPVTINIVDVDEGPEVRLFSRGSGVSESGSGSALSVDENHSGRLATFAASDPESAASLTFTYSLEGTDSGDFTINDQDGMVFFAVTPDYESPADAGRNNVYNLTVKATDSEGKNGSLVITVTVRPVNERPVVSGPKRISWSENRTGTLGSYTRSDPDLPAQTTSWGPVGSSTVLSGANSAAFAFDQSTGRLTFASAPDYEDGGGQYEVTLTANDGSREGMLGVSVTVANLDEFVRDPVTFDARTPVINRTLTATLTDPDTIVSSAWTWQRSTSRTSGWSDIANADSSSYTPLAGDRTYYLRASVTYEDGHGTGKTGQAVTEFAVTNARESNTAPELPASVAAIEIPENSRPGSNAGSPVLASDGQSDPLTYSVSGADEFVIGSTTGQIQVAPGAAFDFDTGTTSYSLTVTVDDGFGGTDTVTVTVNITDVNEAPTADDDAATIREDAPVTIDVLANDSDPEDDRSELTLSVTQVPSKGTVVVNAPPNPGDRATLTYTPRANYHGLDNFVYQVSDTGSPALADTATVSVNVTAVNDDPVFPSAPVTFTVSESAAEGDDVGTPVTATDVEGDTLTYSLSGAAEFVIGSTTGQIQVAPGAAFNAATQDTYTVTVEAEADDGDTGRARVDVTITVTARPAPPPRPPVIFIGGGGGGGGGGPRGPTPSEADFEWTVERDIEEFDSGNDWPTGLWSDGRTLFIAENGSGADDEVYAYDLATGERAEEREFELDTTNRAPRGFWSDRETVWVSDSGRDRLFAYDLATGERDEERELELPRDNRDARGIWSDGETMWVLDGRRDALFAYDLASGELLAEYELASANSDPHGIWSDGTTVWVSDHGAKRLFAYRLPTREEAEGVGEGDAGELERVSDEDFRRLSRVSNNSPRGIWSDGAVMYVADESDDKVYSYNMPDAIDARLASLSLSGVEIGAFSPARTQYEGVPGEGVTETTVEAEAAQRGAAVTIEPGDADEDADGHQVSLADISGITVTVTSPDESRTKVYRVSVPQAEEVVSCLRGDVAAGFNLVIFAGGSVGDLVACAEGRGVTALYALHEGAYISYILSAPPFVNAPFAELFAAGVPAWTVLVAGSDGPPSADPAGAGGGGPHEWPRCLRGDIAAGFSLVLYEGGSVEELVACAERLGVAALYAPHEGEWVSYILGAPPFVNRSFVELYPDGVPALTPLVVRQAQP